MKNIDKYIFDSFLNSGSLDIQQFKVSVMTGDYEECYYLITEKLNRFDLMSLLKEAMHPYFKEKNYPFLKRVFDIPYIFDMMINKINEINFLYDDYIGLHFWNAVDQIKEGNYEHLLDYFQLLEKQKQIFQVRAV